MKQFNKLSIFIVSTSVVATVDLCCAAVQQTNLEVLKDVGYKGPEPINIAEGCTPLEDSCLFLASTCETSLAGKVNMVGINCAPAGFTVPPGGEELCCAQIVPTNYNGVEKLLSEAGNNPLDFALPCFKVGPPSRSDMPEITPSSLGFWNVERVMRETGVCIQIARICFQVNFKLFTATMKCWVSDESTLGILEPIQNNLPILTNGYVARASHQLEPKCAPVARAVTNSYALYWAV
ncbi:hypothetical protein B0H19DRAFT_1070845 [Mycena capillaripes]|nr:hypothetical protein B0H19DRAFT_1070845 [Mycena capillaripes]